ncbi:MFS general substrate transporter [Lentithecium fluviatile CBS 122367]|uniref:MFS general substrate transporter n=1 Tax=Lentithecium fluviatile CBS 122367 TaxID=1168545 RepID=A0A6G1IL24_9PLEO|nr:MFS general substrate transporter [Lentithecium fluviatile CBS 122367]
MAGISSTTKSRSADALNLPPLVSSSETNGALEKQPEWSDEKREKDTPDPNDNVEAGESNADNPTLATRKLSTARRVSIIAILASLYVINTFGTGILVAALPRVALDARLSEALILWPIAVYNLAAGCLLLIFGAVADIIGTKLMWLTGTYLYIVFTLAIGFSRSGIQVIMFRTFQGASIAMSLPTTVSFITNTFPKGNWRNVAFAIVGIGSPLGFALGLVLGGVFADTIGWRWAYYITAIINFLISTSALWLLPNDHHAYHPDSRMRRLTRDIDWVGAIIISAGLGLLLYILAAITSSLRIRDPQAIVLLLLSVSLILLFPFWMRYQTRRNRPALIPNRLWRNAVFSSICACVFLSWAAMNCIQYLTTLFFQQIQKTSALESSLRFIPHVCSGVFINVLTGYLVSRVHIQKLAVISAVVTAASPALMATMHINSNYWFAPFWALVLSPINPDTLFTISNLVISDAFPSDLQSLAGGVFSEIGQFGNSVGLAIIAVIARSVSEQSGAPTHEAWLMVGFRAAFWTIFAGCMAIIPLSFFGLRKGGLIGKKIPNIS